MGVLSPAGIKRVLANRENHRASNDNEFEFSGVGRDAIVRETKHGKYNVIRIWDVRNTAVAENRKLELEESVESIIESHPAAVAYFDKEERLLVWNNAYELAYEAETSKRLRRYQTHHEIFTNRARSRDESETDWQVALEAGRKLFENLESNEMSQKGRAFVTHRRRTKSGGTIVLTQEITLLKETARKLEVTNSALAESNADLELFNRAASHDLKAPIRSIQGLVNVLREDFTDDLNPAALDIIEKIGGSAARVTDLLSGLSELVHIPVAKSDKEILDLPGYVGQLFDEFKQDKSVFAIEYSVSGNKQPCVNALVKIILRNFIGNAIKYSSSSAKPYVTVRCHNENHQIRLSVSDNGLGIDAKDHKIVFGSFKRLHNHSQYPGSGLGLATAKRIADYIGATIELDSSVGNGATFTLVIPISDH